MTWMNGNIHRQKFKLYVFFKHQDLGEWLPTHPAVERDAHSLHDPVAFHRCVEGWLLGLPFCCSDNQLSVLGHQLSVGDPHDTELNLLNDPLLKG